MNERSLINKLPYFCEKNTSMRARNLHKEDLVRQKAIELLVAHGFQGFSMNKLAAAANISVATLYIYYKDKQDLLQKLGLYLGNRYMSALLKGFSSQMPFKEGLKKQWENRSRFAIKHPLETACYEIIQHSSHGEWLEKEMLIPFKEAMGEFCDKAIDEKELKPVPVEVFWSIAYGPLYTLLHFHGGGRSIGGRHFKFSNKVMMQTLDLVLTALTPS